MPFFDTHCDTVIKALDEGLDFVAGGPQAQVDLPRLLQAKSCVQLFAIFMAVGHYPLSGDMIAHAERALDTIHGWAEASRGRLRLALTAADIRAACPGSGEMVYGLIGLEGAECLQGKAENLRHFFERGVRNVIAAWNDNPFSGTVFGQGGPLTEEGGRLIQLCEELRVMVDVSHLSDTAFWQVHDMTSRPFVASHSNCRTVSPSPRNLTDEMIRALADRGGVMGINLSADFLSPDFFAQGWPIWQAAQEAIQAAPDEETRERIDAESTQRVKAIPRPEMAWIARQAQHAIQVGGEDCVGLGGDLDGITSMPEGITGIESYPAIADVLTSAGLTEAQVEKVCWRNMARVYADVLP